MGVEVLNLHQGVMLNPYINYPFDPVASQPLIITRVSKWRFEMCFLRAPRTFRCLGAKHVSNPE